MKQKVTIFTIHTKAAMHNKISLSETKIHSSFSPYCPNNSSADHFVFPRKRGALL